ncbi:MAG: magnesium transporter CorA family protein [Bacteroidales bacterium]|nr:magnesium transporter CorA family protein [Bacteroidales bacterium]
MIETIKIGTIRWHHLVNPTEDDFLYIQETFHFHELDIEDCRSLLNQRPKIDTYDDYYFLILHFPVFDQSNTFIKTREDKIFWGEDFIITMGRADWIISDKFRDTRQRIDKKEDLEIATSDALLYFILEFMMKHTYGVIRRVGDRVDGAGRYLFDRKSVKTIENISVTRKNIIQLNTIFKPQLLLFQRLEKGTIEGYAENMEDYWGNILDAYNKMWDLIEDYSELIEGFSKTFDSMQANRTNEIMKILTFISSILMPMTLISGIYGMNVDLPFGKNPYAFLFIILVMVGVFFGFMFYFKRKKWM